MSISVDPNCRIEAFLHKVNTSGYKEIGLLRRQFVMYILPNLKGSKNLADIALFIDCKDRRIQWCVLRELRKAVNELQFSMCDTKGLSITTDMLLVFLKNCVDDSEDVEENSYILELCCPILADLLVAMLVFGQLNPAEKKPICQHMKATEGAIKKLLALEKKSKALPLILNTFHKFAAECVECADGKRKCSFRVFKNWTDSRVQESDVKAYVKHVPNASTAEAYMVLMALAFKVRYIHRQSNIFKVMLFL